MCQTRAADHAARQRSEKTRSDFIFATVLAWSIKRAPTKAESDDTQRALIRTIRSFQDGEPAA